jgi:hypothetical protein
VLIVHRKPDPPFEHPFAPKPLLTFVSQTEPPGLEAGEVSSNAETSELDGFAATASMYKAPGMLRLVVSMVRKRSKVSSTGPKETVESVRE